ncbi:MAG: flagellar biosynthetic protein FliP, partial [Pseudoalteromonas sp.]|nr:flagellar biosynthetic protein FliP [Pseudoalteromonas sp.]
MTKWLLFIFAMVFVPGVSAEGIDALTITSNADGTQDYSVTLQVLAIMTAMSFIPAAIIMMTSFTRIIVVLAILRQAIGLQQTPSNQVLLGMSLFLSIFIMAPIYEQINERAIEPYLSEQVTSLEALDLAKEPMKAFMLSQVRLKDLETFAKIAGYDQLDSPEATPLIVLIPAFVTSEL